MRTKIPSATVRQLLKLSKRKEALMAQIQDIDRKMVRLQSRFRLSPASIDNPAPVTISRPDKPSRPRMSNS